MCVKNVTGKAHLGPRSNPFGSSYDSSECSTSGTDSLSSSSRSSNSFLSRTFSFKRPPDPFRPRVSPSDDEAPDELDLDCASIQAKPFVQRKRCFQAALPAKSSWANNHQPRHKKQSADSGDRAPLLLVLATSIMNDLTIEVEQRSWRSVGSERTRRDMGSRPTEEEGRATAR
ncbi:hypothetical protein PRIC1_013753 [Phytophthora ramorum]